MMTNTASEEKRCGLVRSCQRRVLERLGRRGEVHRCVRSPRCSILSLTAGERQWWGAWSSSLLERREDACPKHVDEGLLLAVDVVQIDLAHPEDEVLLQPGEMSLRVRRNAHGGLQV